MGFELALEMGLEIGSQIGLDFQGGRPFPESLIPRGYQ